MGLLRISVYRRTGRKELLCFSIYPYFDYPDSLLENNYPVYNYYPSHLYLTDDPVFKYIPTTIEYLLGEEEEKGTALFFDDSTIDGENILYDSL